ncbi:hypothetical protein BAE44_0023203 [Dichanthelium oligosanthes]|uniref:C2H2-type domain-containing protein n=1 Tax=Dichanthelium oligosanthes TaxID=888268 RepID=A0A1E5USH4_9POAL|nr:hypothetical protein BAE44_0023203 [Dichanthelium oligosanthes]
METGVDTAGVLMLLSQQPHGGGARTGGRVFQCKTCGRRFPTFQALGGHRASHTRPRPYYAAAGLRRVTTTLEAAHDEGECAAGPSVHGCPVCGLEFAVGQALGGHMRRHRPTAAAGTLRSGDATSVEGEDVGAGCAAGGICLDLNLAPSENCAKCRKNAGLVGDKVQGVQETLMLDCTL